MGQRILPSQLREIGQREITRLRAQSLSLNSDPLRALTVLGKVLTACECDLRAIEANERKITLHIEAGEKLLARNLRIDGYRLNIQRINENSDELILVLRPGGAS